MICVCFLTAISAFCRNFNEKNLRDSPQHSKCKLCPQLNKYMQFPESWLREFCNPPLSTEQLAETLTMAGLEGEEIKPVAPPFTSIVVGEIKEAVQHPNADRLRVCKVDVGQTALLDIVCGAPNARVGITVPVALAGAA